MGFIVNKKSYLRDGWNFIDFFVVVIGLLSIFPNIPNLKSLRAIRVIKPLRSVKAIPGLKILVSSLLSSIPHMWNVAFFLVFNIILFGIIGI
jgi:hypothetical protein